MQLFAPFSIHPLKRKVLETTKTEARTEDYYFAVDSYLNRGDYQITIRPSDQVPTNGLLVMLRLYEEDGEDDDYLKEKEVKIEKGNTDTIIVRFDNIPTGKYILKLRIFEGTDSFPGRWREENLGTRFFDLEVNNENSNTYSNGKRDAVFNIDIDKEGVLKDNLNVTIGWFIPRDSPFRIYDIGVELQKKNSSGLWENESTVTGVDSGDLINFEYNYKADSKSFLFNGLGEGIYRIKLEPRFSKEGSLGVEDSTGDEVIYSGEIEIEKQDFPQIANNDVLYEYKILGDNYNEVKLTLLRGNEGSGDLQVTAMFVLQSNISSEQARLKGGNYQLDNNSLIVRKSLRKNKKEEIEFSGSAETEYAILMEFENTDTFGQEITKAYEKIEHIMLGSSSIDQSNELGQDATMHVTGSTNMDYYECSMENIRGCFAEFAYLILFKPAAFIFGLTGKALDFTLMYSLDDKSYRSVFVVEGWGIVRDICNLFFIFILLFVAFKVVLNLGGKGNPKSLIINIIIVGLLINFSLFATRVIIDASNILSRVFYNTEVINLGGQNKTKGNFNEIRLSEALVSKVNPQELITKAERIEGIPVKSTEYDNNTNRNVSDQLEISLGGFILVCILAGAVCAIGAYVFFKIAILFIVRVVMLWIAMILSPISFFSYTLPELASLPMVGHKNWWRETVSLAFMAPIFCFFMYVIISFLETGLALIEQGSGGGIAGGFDFVISIVVPFGFLIVLLIKAKEIAETMAGKVGEMASKAVTSVTKTVGGATVGLAAGGAAMAMRGTIGAMGARMASSERLTKMEDKGGFQGFLGRNLRNVGIGMGNKSYDIRNTSLGKKAGEGLGISKSMKGPLSSRSKQGVGIVGNREENLKRMEKREADRDKFRPKTKEEKEKDELIEQQVVLENKNAVEIEKKEKEKEKAKEEYDEKTAEFKRTEDNRKVAEAEYNRSKGTADETGKKKALDDAREQEANALKERNEADAKLKKAREEVANINRGGKTVNIDDAGNHIVNKYNTTNGNITQEMYDKAQEKKREAEAEEVVALAEKQRLEGEKNDKILNVGAEERRKSAQATLVFDEEKQKAEDKRDETIRTAEQSFDRQIGDEEAKLRDLTSQGLLLTTSPQDLARINAEKAKITQKIKDLEANKTRQVSNIRAKADQEYNEMIKLITKNKTDQVAQASKEADEKRQAIIEAVRTAGNKHTEAQNKTNTATATANFAEEAKTYAESNGGFGKSSSGLKNEINELNSKIKQDTNEKMINRADHIPGSWMLTRDQVREKRSKIIESAKRK